MFFSEDFTGASISEHEPSRIGTSNTVGSARPGSVVILNGQSWDGRNCLGIRNPGPMVGGGYVGIRSFNLSGTPVAGDELWVGFSVYFDAGWYDNQLTAATNIKWGAWPGPDYFMMTWIGEDSLYCPMVSSPNVDWGSPALVGGRIEFPPSAVNLSTHRISGGTWQTGEWAPGALVTYRTTGSPIGGLVDGGTYCLSHAIYSEELGLAANTLDAANGNLIALTSQGSGTHSLVVDSVFPIALNLDKWFWIELGYVPAEKRAAFHITARDQVYNGVEVIGANTGSGFYRRSGGAPVAVQKTANRSLVGQCITQRQPTGFGEQAFYENLGTSVHHQRIANFRIANRQALVGPPRGLCSSGRNYSPWKEYEWAQSTKVGAHELRARRLRRFVRGPAHSGGGCEEGSKAFGEAQGAGVNDLIADTPGFMRSTFERGITHVGARNVKAKEASSEGGWTVFHVSWKD